MRYHLDRNDFEGGLFFMRRMPRWSLLLLVVSVLAFAGAAWGLSTLALTEPGEGAVVPGPEVTFKWALTPSEDVTAPGDVYYDLFIAKTLSGLTSPIASMSADTYTFEYPYAGPLDPGSTYFWKVVAHTPSGDVGTTSFFTTEAETGVLALVTPSNGQTGVAPQNIEFKWTYDNGDPGPDPGNVTFDLYLSRSLQQIFDDSSLVEEDQLVLYDPDTGIFSVGLNLTKDLAHNTKYYWTVLVHLPAGDYTVVPRSFTTLAEASDPNLGGGCSAAPLGGLAAMALLAGLALVKRRD
jgi:uncharacterized protein (TIGR03382 family)